MKFCFIMGLEDSLTKLDNNPFELTEIDKDGKFWMA